MNEHDTASLWTLLDAHDLRRKAQAMRERTGIRVELRETAGQGIEVHIVLGRERRGRGRAEALREAEELAKDLEGRIVGTLGPEQLDGNAYLMAGLDLRQRGGAGYGALAKDLSHRVRRAVRRIHRRREKYGRTGNTADKRAARRAWRDAYQFVVRELGLPATVIVEGLDKLQEGERSFEQWEPVSPPRVRAMFQQWHGRRGSQGGRRTPPARDRILKQFNAMEYDRFRRTLERFGIAVPSPTDLRKGIERAWSQKRGDD